MRSSEIRIDEFDSQALAGNPLGDPNVRPVHVYLPPGYRAAGRRYPVTYLLAGFGGSGASFFNYEAWDDDIGGLMDGLLAAGRARPMILVMPDASTRYGGSQYINSDATGRYQDYLLELVAWIDSRYHTRAEPAARAVAGKSSGGFGALRLGMDRPGAFGLVADHCGDKYFEYCYYPALPRFHRAAQGRADLEGVLDNPRAAAPHDQAFRDVMELAALSACYAADPRQPRGFALPFELATGELRPEVWARWLSHDPLRRLPESAEALRGLRLLFLDCGKRDEFFLNVGMRLFHDRLVELGIGHEYVEHDGGHFNLRPRYALSLEAISRAID